MRRAVLAAGLTVAAAIVALAANGQGIRQGQPDVYFGFLLGSPRVAGVAIDLAPADATGRRVLRAYVCDGLGVPDGIAIWFKGEVPADGPSNADPLVLTSVGGQQVLRITALTERGVYGAFTEASGDVAHFVSYKAIDGAGIYQVSLDEQLRYTGTSTDGATLEAQALSDGTTTGTIKPANGKAIAFAIRSLALASPADLADHGFAKEYPQYAAYNQVPGSYVAVIAPGGSHWFGRSGSVQLGSPGVFIIGLDKKEPPPRR